MFGAFDHQSQFSSLRSLQHSLRNCYSLQTYMGVPHPNGGAYNGFGVSDGAEASVFALSLGPSAVTHPFHAEPAHHTSPGDGSFLTEVVPQPPALTLSEPRRAPAEPLAPRLPPSSVPTRGQNAVRPGQMKATFNPYLLKDGTIVHLEPGSRSLPTRVALRTTHAKSFRVPREEVVGRLLKSPSNVVPPAPLACYMERRITSGTSKAKRPERRYLSYVSEGPHCIVFARAIGTAVDAEVTVADRVTKVMTRMELPWTKLGTWEREAVEAGDVTVVYKGRKYAPYPIFHDVPVYSDGVPSDLVAFVFDDPNRLTAVAHALAVDDVLCATPTLEFTRVADDRMAWTTLAEIASSACRVLDSEGTAEECARAFGAHVADDGEALASMRPKGVGHAVYSAEGFVQHREMNSWVHMATRVVLCMRYAAAKEASAKSSAAIDPESSAAHSIVAAQLMDICEPLRSYATAVNNALRGDRELPLAYNTRHQMTGAQTDQLLDAFYWASLHADDETLPEKRSAVRAVLEWYCYRLGYYMKRLRTYKFAEKSNDDRRRKFVARFVEKGAWNLNRAEEVGGDGAPMSGRGKRRKKGSRSR